MNKTFRLFLLAAVAVATLAGLGVAQGNNWETIPDRTLESNATYIELLRVSRIECVKPNAQGREISVEAAGYITAIPGIGERGTELLNLYGEAGRISFPLDDVRDLEGVFGKATGRAVAIMFCLEL